MAGATPAPAPAPVPAPTRPPGSRRGLVGQSAWSSAAALVAMLSGLLLDAALALRFGAGRESDAFFVAARIPVGLAALLMTVATQALVPLFARERAAAGDRALATFASRVLTAASLAGLLLWGVASLLAHPLVAVTAPGLDPAQVALAASMVPTMFLVVPLVAAAETVRAALNASYSFVLPAAMNLFMNGLTAAVVLSYRGGDIRVVAYAYVAGATFQLLVITAVAWLHGVRVRLSARLADPRVRAAVRLSGRPTLSQLLNLGTRVVEQLVASFLPAGSITVLSYGQRLISALGGGIFFRPVTVALLPRLADAEHAGGAEASVRVARLVDRGLRFVLAISLPLTAFTIALADPAVRIVFHRGSFGPIATQMLALTLAVYGVSLAASGVQRVLLAPFFARLDTRTPLRNTIVGVAVELALLLPCVALFGMHRVEGVVGVALAYSLAQYVVVWHAWHRLTATVRLRVRDIVGVTVRLVVASACAYLVMVWLLHLLDLDTADRGRLVVGTVLTALVGAGVLALVGLLLLGGRESRRRLLGRTGEPAHAPLGDSDPVGSVRTTRTDDPETVSHEETRPWGAQRETRALVHQPVIELVGPATFDAPTPDAAPRPDRRVSAATLVLMVGFPAALMVAVVTGVLSVQGVSRTELVLPLAALVGLGFVVLGVVRFEWFVLAALAVRTVVDVTRVAPSATQLGGSSAGSDAVSSGPAATALGVLFIALAVAWLVAQRRAGRGMRPTLADGAFAVFVGSCLLSVVGSVNRGGTLTETARVVAAVLMFVVLERLLTSMAVVRRVLVAAFVALVPPVALGLYQAASGHGRFETAGLSRVVGTFLHPNTFGFFLSMFMLMAVALYRHCPPRVRMALAATVAVCGVLLVLTYSRGSWIAFVLGLVVVGVLQSRLVFAWLAGGVLVSLAALPSVVSRLSDLGAGDTVTGSAGNSLTWRLDYWSSVLQLNHANPVTGIGLRGTRYLTDQSKAPHNDFLRAYAETGALGLLGFVLVLLALLSIARTALRTAEPGLARGIAVGFAAVLLAYVIDSLGDNLMSEVVVLWYVYAFAACAFAVGRLSAARAPSSRTTRAVAT